MKSLLIRRGRLLCPKTRTDQQADIRVEADKVVEIAAAGSLSSAADDKVVDATGLWVLPGLIDVHVHLREPGEEYKEDIETGSKAAAAGGFTTIVAMPNTKPVMDTAELMEYVAKRGREVGACRVLPSGAVTVGQKSEQLAPLGEMADAGAVAFTDDGHPVKDAGLMRSALEYASTIKRPILTHAEECSLSAGGHMHESVVSTRLGLRGIPGAAEDVAVARDIFLAEHTGAHLHICHVSTKHAVELIRSAKARGVQVSGEAAPHHFILTCEAVEGYQTFAKMNPPLRDEEDRLAVIEGLRDGTLECIATDHAPHSVLEKDVPFQDAANGVIGLQSALPLSLELWRRHEMPLLDVVHRLSTGPARTLGLPGGSVEVGTVADLAVIDPEATWKLTPETILSKSTNSPFLGWTLQGRAVLTVMAGRITHEL